LKSTKLVPGNPVKVMLALKADSIEGLHKGEQVTAWADSGPNEISTVDGCPGPYYDPNFVNGLPALYFPNKVNRNNKNISHYLEFKNDADWQFSFDGRPFTVFIVYRPSNTDVYNWTDHKWACILTIGRPLKNGPGFVLAWSKNIYANLGLIAPNLTHKLEKFTQSVISVFSLPHPPNPGVWRVVVFQHRQQADLKNLAVYLNEDLVRCGQKRAAYDYAVVNQASAGLRLGGSEDRLEVPFHGHLAEVIIFKKALDDHDRTGVTHYLKNKYDL